MSTTTVVERPASPSVFTQPTFLFLCVVGVVALAYFYMEATPYFSLNETTLGPYWWPRRWPLMLHISAGTVALLTGPGQVWLGLTYSKPLWHRRLGMVYITSVAVGSIAAFYLLTYTGLGLGFQTGVFGLAVAWVVTTGGWSSPPSASA